MQNSKISLAFGRHTEGRYYVGVLTGAPTDFRIALKGQSFLFFTDTDEENIYAARRVSGGVPFSEIFNASTSSGRSVPIDGHLNIAEPAIILQNVRTRHIFAVTNAQEIRSDCRLEYVLVKPDRNGGIEKVTAFNKQALMEISDGDGPDTWLDAVRRGFVQKPEIVEQARAIRDDIDFVRGLVPPQLRVEVLG